MCHAKGKGVPMNQEQALKWFRLAAGQGDAKAQYQMGICYGKGDGLPQDNVSALMWLNLAVASGDETARNYQRTVSRRLTEGQIAEARRMTLEWKPRPDESGE
jgi:hypothetical protein